MQHTPRARTRIAHNYTAASDNRTAVKDINANGGTDMDTNRFTFVYPEEYNGTSTVNYSSPYLPIAHIYIIRDLYVTRVHFANRDGTGDTTKHSNSGGQTENASEHRLGLAEDLGDSQDR